jgi:phage terminase large subunit GpA-like protein
MEAIRKLLETIKSAIRPDERIGIAAWSERHRVLPESSPEPGKWRNSRTPYLPGIMDALSGMQSTETRYAHDDERVFDNGWVTEVGLQKGHQLGGSALGENFIGRCITSAAGNILAVFATNDDAEKWELDRFEPMRSSTPELRKRVKDSGRKGSDNTKRRKRFPGGMLNLTSATRAGRLKSSTIRYVLLEEIDEYELNVNGQGNPMDLARNRTSNFGRRAKIYANSTPTIDGRSQIQKLYKQGDQRRFFMRCPHCRYPQFFDWKKGMRWTPGDPSSVVYHCQAEWCGVGSPEHAWKTRGFDGAYWMPTAKGDGKTASFHLSSLYAPLGWRPWSDLAREREAAAADQDKMITFVNNTLAECWRDKAHEVQWELIKRRGEPYKLREIPEGCLIVTASVDTQNDRLEAAIDGWGRGLRNWTIDHVVILGDPSTPGPWDELDKLLERPLINRFGVPLRIQLCAVDSGGGRTQDVYDYCRMRAHMGVFAVKGAKERNKPIVGRATEQDVTIRGRTYEKGVKLWAVGTDTAKSKIFGSLLADEERDARDRQLRFSVDLPDEYYKQLVSEAFNPSKGRWDKLRPRNEALDLKVYAFVCAYHPLLRLNVMSDAEWVALENVVEPRIRDLLTEPMNPAFAEAVEVVSQEPQQPTAPGVAQGARNNPPRAAWLPRRVNWLR